jgi:hypothetical protein
VSNTLALHSRKATSTPLVHLWQPWRDEFGDIQDTHRLGAKILADIGFEPKGINLSLIMVDKDDKDGRQSWRQQPLPLQSMDISHSPGGQ